ncbi:MAG: hypothetical protein QHC90_03490 [Shinella sp.]|nr:hypothetical protein [Shinella sp.]
MGSPVRSPSEPVSSRQSPFQTARSLLSFRFLFLGALSWGALMMACALVSLYLRNRLETENLPALAALFFAGGAFAWPFVMTTLALFRRNRTETRFAAAFAFLALGTIAMTAFLFAMDYRLFYAQWHHPFPTRIWAYQFVFTSISAVYQFSVMGLRLFMPAGLPVLAAASLWLAKAMR